MGNFCSSSLQQSPVCTSRVACTYGVYTSSSVFPFPKATTNVSSEYAKSVSLQPINVYADSNSETVSFILITRSVPYAHFDTCFVSKGDS